MSTERLSLWARVYVASITLLGACAIAQSVYALYSEPIGWNWFVLAILTLISGSATVKLPSVSATISVSETFVFTSVLLFGSAAGTITVALDALVISLWLARRGHPFYRIAFNVCALPASLWLAAHLFYYIWGNTPLSLASSPVQIQKLIQPLIVFTLSYFLLNSWLIAFAISLEKHLNPFQVWRDNFAWLSLNYFGGASVAALLVSYTRNIDYAYLAFVLPLLAVLYFTFSMSMGRVEDANRHLRELNKLYMSTIETLAMAIDAKDQITHGHIRRVQTYAGRLATALGVKDEKQLKAIEAASLLHDMGKLAVPEHILNKPGPLTPAEFEKMKLHASVGADILSAIDFPYPVVPIVRHHHESWDGSGYPDGLRGSDIPLGARILSVVDCFDALTSDRPYRPRLSDNDAVAILQQRRGSMYDPLVVDTFIANLASLTIYNPDTTEENSRPSPIGRSETSRNSLEGINSSAEETVTLLNMAKALSGALDLGVNVQIVAQHLRRLLPSCTCVLYLLDVETDELEAVHASGELGPHLVGTKIARGQRLSGWVAANHRSIVNSDPVLDLGETSRSLRPRLKSCLSTPLMADGQLLGVLTFYAYEEKAFTDDHRRVAESASGQVASVVKRVIDGPAAHPPRPNPRSLCRSAEELDSFLAARIREGSGSVSSVIFVRSEPHNAAPAGEIDPFLVLQFVRTIDGFKQPPLLFDHRPGEIVILLPDTDTSAALEISEQIGRAASRWLPTSGSRAAGFRWILRVASAPADGLTMAELEQASSARGVVGPFPLPSEPGVVH